MNKRKLSLKWFGSLTSLSTWRPSSKANIQAAPDHGENLSGGSSAAVADKSADDTECCLHSPSYAPSCDMYTHVGTVPRRAHQKKNKKKEEEEEAVRGVQSQWRVGDDVQNSSLLSALSSLVVTTLDQPLPGASHTPREASPLTPAPKRWARLPSGHHINTQEAPVKGKDAVETGRRVVEKLSNMATDDVQVVPTQDVYVLMDPVGEAAQGCVDEQKDRQPREHTNLASGAQEVRMTDTDARMSRHDLTHSDREYAKFSKDKFWLEPPSEEQRKQLEEELNLSSINLRSHTWYHGNIPWEVSEDLVVNHGDFLVRDSQSSRGDFVLTSRWEQKTLHFLIRKTVVESSGTCPQVRYSLNDEAFHTLPKLVHFFMGSKGALAQWSCAQIHQPVNRSLPLSYLETASGAVDSPAFCRQGLQPCRVSRIAPKSPSSLHHKGEDISKGQDNQTLVTPGESALPCPSSHAPQSRSPFSLQAASVVSSPSLARCSDTAGSSFSPIIARNRQSDHGSAAQLKQDLSDTEESCYTELCPGPRSYVERLLPEGGSRSDEPLRVEEMTSIFSPKVEAVSCFKPNSYHSQLMPKENKPLEVGVLQKVKNLLADTDPRTVAQHITKADCTVARILDVTPEVQRMMGVSSGMELLTLPHGQQLRRYLLERFQTLAIMLAVDLLGCTGTNEERAGLLHKIIQIAAELKSTMGNMFGFAAVMRALELPQVSRLEQMWTALRQRHTEGAVLYEKILRPFIKSLNDGRENCPVSNTTFPHVLPLVSLMEKSVAVGEGTEPWEMADVGMDVVMFHLGAARTIAQLGNIYQYNAQNKLQGFHEKAEVMELFMTDFQLRLLWGSRGATESPALRYAKFDQVLSALSNKLEPPVRLH